MANFTAENGYIYRTDTQGNCEDVHLRASNWFGAEEGRGIPTMWGNSYKVILDRVANMGLNCIRFPITNDTVTPGNPISNITQNADNDDFNGLDSMGALDVIIDYWVNTHNGYFLFDWHKLYKDVPLGSGPNNGLWYDGTRTEQDWINTNVFLANRYANYSDNFIGLDICNEPYNSKWDSSNDADNWKRAAEVCGQAVLNANPNLLIFVQGNNDGQGAYYSIDTGELQGQQAWFNWGSGLTGAFLHPLNHSFIPKNKTVYAPHPYGPDVIGPFNGTFASQNMNGANYPQNMHPQWMNQFGFLVAQGYTLSYTEYAGLLVDKPGGDAAREALDVLHQRELARWSKEVLNIPQWNHMYWAINNESGDTSGILQDNWFDYNPTVLNHLQNEMWNGYIDDATCSGFSGGEGGGTTTHTAPGPCRFRVYTGNTGTVKSILI